MKRWILVFVLCVGFGFSVFFWFAVRATDIRQESTERASTAFAQAKSTFPAAQPKIRRNASGDWIRRSTPAPPAEPDASHLYVLAYQAEKERLSRTQIPLWFLRMKEAPLRFVLARSGIDLGEANISVRELEETGPQLVLDEVEPSGNRVLIWTQ